MAHELTIRSNGRAEMAWTGTVPWHGLGQELPAGAPIETWLEAAGMDWSIASSPVCYGHDDRFLTWSDRMVLYRDDTTAPLGVVSDDYKPVQPREVLNFFRDLCSEKGYVLHTAGTLFGGRRFWALARVTEDMPVLDSRDRVGGFLLLSTSADGSLATEARFTTIRVVCNNTLSAAVRGKASFRATHKTVFDHKEAKRALGLKIGDGFETIEQTMETFRQMARTPLSPTDMIGLTLKAFGHKPEEMEPKDLQAAMETRAVQQVSQLAVNGSVGSTFDGADQTAWGWLNAVTQFVDHHARAKSPNNRLDSAWFGRGDALKSKALELATVAAGPVTSYVDVPDDGPSLLDAVLAQPVGSR